MRGNESTRRRVLRQFDSMALSTIRRHLDRLLRRRLESHDLLNDFWVSVFRRIDRLPNISDSAGVRAYLRKIAQRQVLKQRRRHLREQCRTVLKEANDVCLDALPADESARALNRMEHSEMIDKLRDVISEEDWGILERKVEGKSNREIARELGVDEGTVRRAHRRICRSASKLDSSVS